MASSVRLEIITPSKKFYQGDVELVIVRTLEGDEGFMKGHAWACKLLDIGEMWIQEKGAAKNSYKVAAIAGGFIDVKDTLIIYTDAVEWAEDIDMERVNAEKSRAEEWLRDHEADGTPDEILRARTSIAKAELRADVAGGGRRRKH